MPCIDGEGKPVIKESPYSDEQGLSQMESISLRSMLMVSGLALSVSHSLASSPRGKPTHLMGKQLAQPEVRAAIASPFGRGGSAKH